MLTKMICASVLVTSSVPVLGQPAGDGDGLVWPYIYTCSVVPNADWYAINTKGTGANSGRLAAAGMSASWNRIDLQFDVSAPSSGGTIPTITAHAINTKGTAGSSGRVSEDFRYKVDHKRTGTSSGRLSAKPSGTVTVFCTGNDPSGDPATQKANFQDLHISSRAARQSVGWSCAVTDSEEAPQFSLTLLVPVILGVAERATTSKKHTIGGQEDARLESKRESNGSIGAHHVAIVQHGSNTGGGPRIACSSASREGGGWDVLILS